MFKILFFLLVITFLGVGANRAAEKVAIEEFKETIEAGSTNPTEFSSTFETLLDLWNTYIITKNHYWTKCLCVKEPLFSTNIFPFAFILLITILLIVLLVNHWEKVITKWTNGQKKLFGPLLIIMAGYSYLIIFLADNFPPQGAITFIDFYIGAPYYIWILEPIFGEVKKEYEYNKISNWEKFFIILKLVLVFTWLGYLLIMSF